MYVFVFISSPGIFISLGDRPIFGFWKMIKKIAFPHKRVISLVCNFDDFTEDSLSSIYIVSNLWLNLGTL